MALAVRLGIAIARNHGFADGNKRTGAIAMMGFLAVNGHALDMPDDTLLGRMIEAVLTYDMTEEELAGHISGYVRG